MDVPSASKPGSFVPRSLGQPRARNVVRTLRERTAPLTIDALVSRVATHEWDDGHGRPEPVDRSRIRADLIHHVLPALVATSLVEWDRRTETVRATDHHPLDDEWLDRLLDADDDAARALVILARPLRLLLVEALRWYGPLTRAELASLVHEHPVDLNLSASSASDRLQASLHHVHLPALDDAGFLDYDPCDGVATYSEHPAVPHQWLDSLVSASPRLPAPSSRRNAG